MSSLLIGIVQYILVTEIIFFFCFSYNTSVRQNISVKNDIRPTIVNFTLHTLKQSSGNLMYNLFFPRK